MENFFEVVKFDDIAIAAITAFVLTIMIKHLLNGFKFVSISGDIQINYDTKNFKSVLRNCYDLFPKDIVSFNGDTFKRGMKVQVLTSSNKVIKGEIVGVNSDNMLCLITAKYIIAQEMSQILVMIPINNNDVSA